MGFKNLKTQSVFKNIQNLFKNYSNLFRGRSASFRRHKILYFTLFSRHRKRQKGTKQCVLQGVRAFGKGQKAQNTVFYSVFAPSEKAKRPKTLYFTMFSRLRKRPKGPWIQNSKNSNFLNGIQKFKVFKTYSKNIQKSFKTYSNFPKRENIVKHSVLGFLACSRGAKTL